METPEPQRHLLRRIVVALSALVVIVFLGSAVLWMLGRVYVAHPWSFGDCLFFVITTVTTVGFGELPQLGRVPGGHVTTVIVLLLGLGVSLYCFSALTTYFVEGEFGRARQRRKVRKMLDRINDHIIVCGVGTTGIHVVEELLATGWPLVAIDLDGMHLEKVQRLAPSLVPVILGDATDDAVLERAGIRRAKGLVAALTDDKANLYIVVTARELNPHLKIVAKGVDVKAAEKLKHAGADTVVNPAYIGGMRMVSEMVRPQVTEFLDQMLRDKDKKLRIEEVTIPTDSSLVGKPLGEAHIRRHTELLVVAVREPPVGNEAGRFVYNPGADTLLSANMTLIVLGETQSVLKLRAALKSGGFQGQP